MMAVPILLKGIFSSIPENWLIPFELFERLVVVAQLIDFVPRFGVHSFEGQP